LSAPSADRFIDGLFASCHHLAVFPGMGRARDELAAGLRCFPHQRFSIFYRLHDDALEIVRVLHASRDIDAIDEAD
jgi:toxin ParE1/3/4